MDKLIGMQLVIAIGDKVLEAMDVDAELIKEADYLAALQDILATRHFPNIAAYQKNPHFYLQAQSGLPKPSK